MTKSIIQPNGKLNIFSYTSYRRFLSDFYFIEKEKNPQRFSYRYFSKKAGFSTSNFIYLVIQGRRNLSYESITHIAAAMGLPKRECLFFETIVHFNQAKDPQEKDRLFDKISSFKEYREARVSTPKLYDYHSRWYYPVVRELVKLNDFREDPAWITKKLGLRISRDEAREALGTLEDLNFLVRDSKGHLKQADPEKIGDKEVSSAARLIFQDQMLEQGRKILQSAKKKDISSVTLSLTDQEFQEVQERIHSLERDVQTMSSKNRKEKPSLVCQLNFQLFSHTDEPLNS